MGLNHGDILDAVAKQRSHQLAISSDTGDLTWREFDERSNALARGMNEIGIKVGDKVCFLLFNSAAYLEVLAACFKGRFVHVNANFRYLTHEIEYILDNSDSAVIFYDYRLADKVGGINSNLTNNVRLVEVGSTPPVIEGAIPYENLIKDKETSTLNIRRSGEDLIFIYTGGTTGKPKGVMWPHHEQAIALFAGGTGDRETQPTVKAMIDNLDEPKGYLRPVLASPLMHAAGLYAAITTFSNGGHVILTDNSGRFDAAHHWGLVQKYKADAMSIVGDTFAKPLLKALDEGSFDVSTMKVIGSSGVMWSTPVKLGLLEHMPQAAMYDSLGSSEAMGLGASVLTSQGQAETATFKIGTSCKVFDENDEEVIPGSGTPGTLARFGPMPLGYYKDEKKTAETFRMIKGQRYTIPGDLCTVDSDGTINLLGRGSSCINTGGEKVFPEEVEEALKTHDNIEDALVFGIPDEKWGSAVQAVITLKGVTSVDVDELRTYLRVHLAPYKIPKQIIPTNKDLRLANGKPDYSTAKAQLAAAL